MKYLTKSDLMELQEMVSVKIDNLNKTIEESTDDRLDEVIRTKIEDMEYLLNRLYKEQQESSPA